MREILFRGKSTASGEWIYGDLRQVNREDFYIQSNIDMWEKVDKSTIGQFTGLLDKNHTKIFEGDIVKRELAYITIDALVSWNNKYLQYELKCVAGKHKGESWWLTSNSEDYELVGDIYDSPELLKKKQK